MKLKNNNIKCIVFDLDGTIYLGNKLVDSANEIILYCRQKYKNIFFATNNSAITRKNVYNKLINLKIDVTEDEVINVSYLIKNYLQNNNYSNVFCLGTEQLKEEIKSAKINITKHNPEAIIIGYDKDFNLTKLEEAINAYNTNCSIIIANNERVYPRENGIITPGAGAIVKAFEHTINKQANIIIGKPQTVMLQMIAKKLNILPENILVVGDSIESDIKMADDFGSQSILISKDTNYKGYRINALKEILEIL